MEKKYIAYNLGDMLYKGSQMLRAKECEELRALGIEIYSAAEQNSHGDINDKTGQTVESNNNLHALIYKKDVDAIYHSNLIICNPERFAEGSICELGIVEDFNHWHDSMSKIIYNPNLRDSEKVDAIQRWLEIYPRKEVYVHLEDIRCTDLPESGYNRSFYMNQFVRGAAVAAMTGERGVPVSLGGTDIMSWDEIMSTLKAKLNKEDKEELSQTCEDGFIKVPLYEVTVGDKIVIKNLTKLYEEAVASEDDFMELVDGFKFHNTMREYCGEHLTVTKAITCLDYQHKGMTYAVEETVFSFSDSCVAYAYRENKQDDTQKVVKSTEKVEPRLEVIGIDGKFYTEIDVEDIQPGDVIELKTLDEIINNSEGYIDNDEDLTLWDSGYYIPKEVIEHLGNTWVVSDLNDDLEDDWDDYELAASILIDGKESTYYYPSVIIKKAWRSR